MSRVVLIPLLSLLLMVPLRAGERCTPHLLSHLKADRLSLFSLVVFFSPPFLLLTENTTQTSMLNANSAVTPICKCHASPPSLSEGPSWTEKKDRRKGCADDLIERAALSATSPEWTLGARFIGPVCACECPSLKCPFKGVLELMN